MLLSKIRLCPGFWRDALHIAANLWPDDLTTEPMLSLLQVAAEQDTLVVALCLTERPARLTLSNLDFVKEVCQALASIIAPSTEVKEGLRALFNDRDSRIRAFVVEALVAHANSCLNLDLEEFAETGPGAPERSEAIRALDALGSARVDDLWAILDKDFPLQSDDSEAEEAIQEDEEEALPQL